MSSLAKGTTSIRWDAEPGRGITSDVNNPVARGGVPSLKDWPSRAVRPRSS